MKEIRTEIQSVEVARVLCNKCGKSCEIWINWEETIATSQFATLAASWGYGSGRDGDSGESHLCEACYTEIVSGFKIPPTPIHPNPFAA